MFLPPYYCVRLFFDIEKDGTFQSHHSEKICAALIHIFIVALYKLRHIKDSLFTANIG